MGRNLFIAACLGILSQTTVAADAAPESCEQIRAQIGMPPLADPVLLRKLAARKDCSFTAAEVYKAAYGNRPPAKEAPRLRRMEEEDDDD